LRIDFGIVLNTKMEFNYYHFKMCRISICYFACSRGGITTKVQDISSIPKVGNDLFDTVY
jgi:hypothetical protein